MKIQDSISINADRARVFEVFCDLDNAPATISGITKLDVLAGPAALNEGTKWRETRMHQDLVDLKRVCETA